MRILQCPVPGVRLEPAVGSTVIETLSYFATMALAYPPLIDDGASDSLFRGAATMNPPCVNPITGEAALLFCAKDMKTLRRGFEAYSGTWVLKSGEGTGGLGDGGGLGMIAATFDRTSGTKVGKFVKWGVNNAKQHFLRDVFKIASWFTKHSLDYVDNRVANQKLASLFRTMGGDHLFTFGDFRRTIDSDATLQSRGALVLICRTIDLAPDFEVPGGRVQRYVNETMKVKAVGDFATRLVKKPKEREHTSGGIFD